MKPSRPLLAGLIAVAVLTPAHALVPIDLARLKLTGDRINQLYQPRTDTPPPVNPRHNPFRIGGDPLPIDNRGQDDAHAVTSDEVLLRQAAATLKVSGVLEIGGTLRLSINTANYGVGDVLQVRLGSGNVFLRVAAITPRSVTLRLNEAELVQSF
ncbi:MAG TPA: hypothetical protein PKY38_03945 [Opitutaceae bacterium]|nr:hypothetical protein [Opitutaceae bacterium]